MARRFQRWAGILLGSLLLAGHAGAMDLAIGGRSVLALRDGWHFRYTGTPGDAKALTAATLDDSGWQKISLPHTWNHFGEYRLTRSDDIDSAQGVGWYRLTLAGSDIPSGQRRFLQFDGVGNVADVWVNGVHVGRHAGAFSRFRFDVTDAWHADGSNQIVVRADNSQPAPGSTTQDVIPLMGDFFIHGGLYRSVSLIGTAAVHVDLLDHGGPGVYVRADHIDTDTAQVHVRTRLRNDARSMQSVVLGVEIRDAKDAVVSRSERSVSLKPRVTDDIATRLVLHHPHLWNGRKDPYLYRVIATVHDGTQVLDRVTQPWGVRTFRFDANKGFFLNGHHLALHGVSRHQDREGKGWAITAADAASDMALVAEMGANTVRFAHYQHAQSWFDAADKAGMVVWSEIPFVNKVAFTDAPASPALVANARQQLIELIRQNSNHPSVVTWGVGNEVDIDMAQGKLGPKADPRPLLRNLSALAKQEDPTRPTTMADCCEATPGSTPSAVPMLAGITDLMGYNRYFGWYYGKVGDFGPYMDSLHAAHPGLPLSVSEFGAGGALSQHTDNPRGGPINDSGRPHPEEFQSWWHEQSWPQLAKRPYLWASWVWNMFDFASNIRHEGDSTDLNDKGLVSYDRKVKKDAFYFYKAHWSDQPVVHISGRRYVHRAYAVNDVRIYSNADAVQVSLNGHALGRVACKERICVLHDVALAPGGNHVVAQARFGQRTVSDAVDWDAPDATHGLAINVGDLSGYAAAD
ncbi:MAG: beta-galactosidase, partial [Pseudomonadota bacterium]|nr:beta-galactosidase [Pseudomonadota bacterium]